MRKNAGEDILALWGSHDDYFSLVKLPGASTAGWFTTASDLTNKVPGQSDKEKKELAEPHISRVPDTSVGPSGDSSTLGHTLVSMPSSVPILKGTGMAGTDSRGFGALICPDENHLIAFEDYGVDASKDHERVDSWGELKQFGCSYVPPGTPMVSNGANEHRSLAFVTAELPDGTRIRGVTFPRMFVQNQLQREESKRDAAALPHHCPQWTRTHRSRPPRIKLIALGKMPGVLSLLARMALVTQAARTVPIHGIPKRPAQQRSMGL